MKIKMLGFFCTVFLALFATAFAEIDEKALVCPPGIIDRFPIPGVCDQFYECFNGQASIFSCESGLWFNKDLKICVNPSSSNCGIYSSTIQPTWSTPVYDVCYGVPPNYISLKPYPGDCTLFYECIGDSATLQSCSPGYWFNAANQMCDLPEFSNCHSPTNTPFPTDTTREEYNDPRCASVVHGYFSYAIDCSLYVECLNGHGYIMECPRGLYFDDRSKKCISPAYSDCGITGTPTPPTRATGWTPDPDCPWPTPLIYLFPYPGDCTKFIECVYGEKIIRTCDPGLWFNPTLLICDYPYHSGCQ